MSAERDELRRLVDELPDDQVPGMLARVRSRLQPATDTAWPPKFFGIGTGRHTDTSTRIDELLADGFGRAR